MAFLPHPLGLVSLHPEGDDRVTIVNEKHIVEAIEGSSDLLLAGIIQLLDIPIEGQAAIVFVSAERTRIVDDSARVDFDLLGHVAVSLLTNTY